jgi:hypothetical protein
MTPTLFGPTGKPVSSTTLGWTGNRLYKTPANVARSDRPRPRARLSAETRKNISDCDRRDLITYSRLLKAQCGNVRGAIALKNMYAFGDGFDVHYMGANSKWGEEATEYIRNTFFPFCNPRGENFDFHQTLLLTGYALDTDGGDLAIFTTKGRGFPQVKIIPATMIGTGDRGFETVPGGMVVRGGPFDGARIHDGIIFDRENVMLAVRVWGEDENGNMTYADIDKAFCQLIFEPEWSDQLQGVPRMATALIDLMHVEDVKDYLLTAIKIASALAVNRITEDGEPNAAERTTQEEVVSDFDTSTTRQVTYEDIAPGIYELKTDEKLQALSFERPSMNEEEFSKRVESAALLSLGWPRHLIDPSELARAPVRLVTQIGRMCVWERQKAGIRRTRRVLTWAIAKGMKEGYLSRNDDGKDAYMWEIGLPAELTIDEGNDRKADIDDLKLGITSKTNILQKAGRHRSEMRKQRDEEMREAAEDAAKFSAEFPQLKFEQWLDRFEQRGPNLQAAPKPETPAKTPDDE